MMPKSFFGKSDLLEKLQEKKVEGVLSQDKGDGDTHAAIIANSVVLTPDTTNVLANPWRNTLRVQARLVRNIQT